MDDRALRATALEVASRSGLPPRLTLEAARDFYNFLSGKEPTPAEWTVANIHNALVAARDTAASSKRGLVKGAKGVTPKRVRR